MVFIAGFLMTFWQIVAIYSNVFKPIVKSMHMKSISIIETVIINWKRPRNVEKIVRSLRDQTVPCTITICDCHVESLFSLSEECLGSVDRIYHWKTHNLGAFSRYIPIPSLDHPYTFFIDDDLLPGNRCLESFLRASLKKPEFGVLGQFGRIINPNGIYSPVEIQRSNSFIETDFIVRAYFTKTQYLHNIVRFRWQIGYFNEPHLEDDLLLCASLKYYENLPCYLIPKDQDIESLVNKKELSTNDALSHRQDHIIRRISFVKRLKYYGWKPINSSDNMIKVQKSCIDPQ